MDTFCHSYALNLFKLNIISVDSYKKMEDELTCPCLSRLLQRAPDFYLALTVYVAAVYKISSTQELEEEKKVSNEDSRLIMSELQYLLHTV